MAAQSNILTEEEALKLPVNPLDEIVDGEVRTMPPPELNHALLLTVLLRTIFRQLTEQEYHATTTAFGLGISKSPLTVRNPDLAVFGVEEAVAHLSQQSGYLWVAPKLVVECLSPANRKRSVLRLLADYESIGVPEVWLIRPQQRLVEVYRLEDGEYGRAEIETGDKVRAASVPVEVPLPRLWEAFETGR